LSLRQSALPALSQRRRRRLSPGSRCAQSRAPELNGKAPFASPPRLSAWEVGFGSWSCRNRFDVSRGNAAAARPRMPGSLHRETVLAQQPTLGSLQ
jgi:hypothetical protein